MSSNDTIYHIEGEIAIGADEDFFIDYTDTLAEVSPADTITSSSWALTGNATLGSDSFTTQVAAAWVSAAQKLGDIIKLVNTVGTAGGRTHVRTLLLKVVTQHAQKVEADAVTIP